MVGQSPVLDKRFRVGFRFLYLVRTMRIVFIGSGEFGIDSLDAMAETDNTLELIVTSTARPAGRGRKPRPTKVASWAQKHLAPFVEVEDVNAREVIERIANCEPDLIVVIAFGQKISNELINLPPRGMINVHASLVPKYRGAAPINWPIINGDTNTGVSIITVCEKMDAGDILATVETRIGPEETAGELHDRLAEMAGPLLAETIETIAEGSVVYTRQDHSKATPAHKLKKSDGFLDFNEPAEMLSRKIRGFWPWPGASAVYVPKKTGKREQVTIALAEAVAPVGRADDAPGALDESLNITCGDGALRIKKIKPAGGGQMDFKAFVNGRQSEPGDLFVKIDK